MNRRSGVGRSIIGALACTAIMWLLHETTPYWWWIAVVPAIYGAFFARGFGGAAATGASSAGSLWLVASLVEWLGGAKIIAARVAVAMHLSHPALVVLAAGVVAAVVGCLAALAGRALRSAIADG